MKNMKRIHKVVIKRMIDESPDTSWLGEYGSRAESDYSIDREHATDCPQQTYNRKPDSAYVTPEDEELVHGSEVTLEQLREDRRADDEECNCGGQHLDRNSCQFFNPNHENYAGIGHEETVKYCLQDYARMEALNNGDFCFIGILAEADYTLTGSIMQEATSGGLWGIESDSGVYLKEVEAEELASLKAELKAIGFSSRAISTAFKNVEYTGDAR